MHDLRLGSGPDAPRSFLFLGAHADDIEIGCGATVRRLVARFPAADFTWVVFTSDDTRAHEARSAAASFLTGAEHVTVDVGTFRDGHLAFAGSEVKDRFEDLKTTCSPDLIFTHHHLDAHQDHRFVAELTWQTFRDHTILGYEIPKFDADLGSPNLFVAVDEGACREKIRLLLEHFPSQRSRSWFDESTFRAVMRLRGLECNASEGLAEAFYARKAVVRL
jgi:LmbE family N-acetylglucosaminyl deacetylase